MFSPSIPFLASTLCLTALFNIPVVAEESDLKVYFGNLHSHSAYSDGSGTPAEAYAYARDVAGLDFLALTDHDHLLGGEKATAEQRELLYSGPGKDAIIPTADSFNTEGKFVALYGQEYSKGSHINVFQVPETVKVPDRAFPQLVEWLKTHPDATGQPAVIQLNHPMLGGPPSKSEIYKTDFGRAAFGDDATWVRDLGAQTSLVEILNGEPLKTDPNHRSPQQMELFYRILLQLGFHLAPTADQDNHHGQWGDATNSRTGIIAPALTRKDLLDAMRARHVFATEDKNLKIIFRVDGQLCGDVLAGPVGDRKISYQIQDGDEPEAEYTIEVFRGQIGGPLAEIVQSQIQKGNTDSGILPGVSMDQDGQFIFFRVTQKGDIPDRAWTAPVWLQKK